MVVPHCGWDGEWAVNFVQSNMDVRGWQGPDKVWGRLIALE